MWVYGARAVNPRACEACPPFFCAVEDGAKKAARDLVGWLCPGRVVFCVRLCLPEPVFRPGSTSGGLQGRESCFKEGLVRGVLKML